VLRPRAGVGNHNVVVRAKAGISSGRAQLWLGEVAKITSNHRVDCMRSFRLGRFSTLAGAGSQVWTHGYVHDELGEGRYRIDGKVIVEENVYIGSACFISMGIRISKGVIVGGGTTVSKSLTAPGLYVSAPMRALPRPVPPESRDDLRRSSDSLLCETVFVKDTDHRLA
jgi:acetyltransferase-like isoleucine patch superfamily enzyme